MTSERCAAADRCVWYDAREKIAAETEDGPLCEGEITAGERSVVALVHDFSALEQQIPRSLSSRGDGQPGRPDEHPVPINLSVEAAQREIHRILTIWEEVLRDADRLSTPEPAVWSHWSAPDPQVKPGVEVQRAARIIAPRVRLLSKIGPVTIADYPDVEDEEAHQLGGLVYADLPGWRGVLDFARLHGKAQQLLLLTPPRPEPCWGVPCRACDLTALVRDPGEDTVHCGACGERYTAGQYRDWVKLVGAHVEQDGAA